MESEVRTRYPGWQRFEYQDLCNGERLEGGLGSLGRISYIVTSSY